jgi:hypothetical protein
VFRAVAAGAPPVVGAGGILTVGVGIFYLLALTSRLSELANECIVILVRSPGNFLVELRREKCGAVACGGFDFTVSDAHISEKLHENVTLV